MFTDIVCDGVNFKNYNEESKRVSSFVRQCYKPKYYEEFYDENDTQFASELPTTIFQKADDDRQIVPRMGIEEKTANALTYIDVHEVAYQ